FWLFDVNVRGAGSSRFGHLEQHKQDNQTNSTQNCSCDERGMITHPTYPENCLGVSLRSPSESRCIARLCKSNSNLISCPLAKVVLGKLCPHIPGGPRNTPILLGIEAFAQFERIDSNNVFFDLAFF